MKEGPILFGAPMVRAILAGRKTQTRRVFKVPKGLAWYCSGALRGEETGDLHDIAGPGWCSIDELSCPYGQPGGRLWVRESWQSHIGSYGESSVYAYRATDDDRLGPWRPSIHMPRVACRLVLEITGVRVERLQEISEADAQAEGIEYDPGDGGTFHVPGLAGCCSDSAADSFRKLWESINGAESWAANPWTWVVEFAQVKQ